MTHDGIDLFNAAGPVVSPVGGEELMSRLIAAFLLCMSLPACSISPPTSAFSSLSKDDDKSAERTVSRASLAPKKEDKGGIGNSLNNVWASVKSGLSFGGGDEEAIGETEEITAFDPQQAAQIINSYRAQNGLPPLRLNPLLSQAAQAHSQDLSRNDRISHFGSDGSDTLERVRRTGYTPRLTAENVGTGQRSLQELINGWKNSHDHNDNLLLADAEEMGIAMVNNPDTKFKTFWTMVLGSRLNATAAN